MNKKQSQTIGILLLMGLFLLQVTYFSPTPEEKAEEVKAPQVDTKKTTWLDPSYHISHHLIKVENKDVILAFSEEGGQLAQVVLKNHKDQEGNPLSLIEPETTQMRTTFSAPTGALIDTAQMEFKTNIQKTAEGTKVTLTAYWQNDDSLWVKQTFLLPQQGYSVDYSLEKSEALQGSENPTIFHWTQQLLNKETHAEQSLEKTLIKYYNTDRYLKELKENKAEANKEMPNSPLHWIAIHRPYFLIGIAAEDLLTENSLSIQPAATDEPNILKEIAVETALPKNVTFYFGPNEYYTLQGIGKDFEKNYYLGPRLFKRVNAYLILPISEYLKKYFPNYIWILILLILLLNLLQFFFPYQSYVNNLRMKAAKPIIDQINPTGSNDPQHALTTMQIHTKIGASPLKALLYGFIQIPILIAMVNFTRYQIDFRHLSFLWISDISAYDDLIHFPFRIPVLGSHLSLIGVISSVLFFIISRLKTPPNTTNDSSTQMLAYTMPIIFLVMFNGMPSSWWIYRLFNNVVELALYGLMKLIVNEKRISEETYKKAKAAYESSKSGQTQNRAFKRSQKKK